MHTTNSMLWEMNQKGESPIEVCIFVWNLTCLKAESNKTTMEEKS